MTEATPAQETTGEPVVETPTPRKRAARKTADDKPKSTTVKVGDNIGAVAARLGVSVEHVVKVNGLRHHLLYTGQRVSR